MNFLHYHCLVFNLQIKLVHINFANYILENGNQLTEQVRRNAGVILFLENGLQSV